MIRLRVTRSNDDGSETELGELRMTELGAKPAVYRETADGSAIMRDVRAALACLAPENLRVVRRAAHECICKRGTWRGKQGRFSNPECEAHADDSWLGRLRRGEVTH